MIQTVGHLTESTTATGLWSIVTLAIGSALGVGLTYFLAAPGRFRKEQRGDLKEVRAGVSRIEVAQGLFRAEFDQHVKSQVRLARIVSRLSARQVQLAHRQAALEARMSNQAPVPFWPIDDDLMDDTDLDDLGHTP